MIQENEFVLFCVKMISENVKTKCVFFQHRNLMNVQAEAIQVKFGTAGASFNIFYYN